MRKYTVPTLLCAALLLVSAVARALLEWSPFVAYFPYLVWVHVAVIALAGTGFWVLHKIRSAHSGGLVTFLRGLPIWLAALAVPVVLAAAPIFMLATHSPGTTPDGQSVTRKSWVQEEVRYYVILNRTTRFEITETEYTEMNREMFIAFSSAWILFSYLSLVLWHYNRRMAATSDPATLARQ